MSVGGMSTASPEPLVIVAKVNADGNAAWLREFQGDAELKDIQVIDRRVALLANFDGMFGVDQAFPVASGIDIYLAAFAL